MGARDKKLENRYRFQTFSERIAAISADVAHDVSVARNETPEDADTFFFEELQKWSDLNLTQHYAEFQAELGEDVQSFAQLLLRKDEIIGLLQKHLSVPESLALQPLLALLAALARDLRADLGPAFPSLFGLLCGLLDTHEPERLQWVFTCLAHLYKLLWRHLVAHLEDTYRMYRQLIAGGRPGHVVRFAAESFAFVCRKVKDKTKFFRFIYGKLRGSESETNGVGRLIFETVRGVRGRLHVDAAGVLHVQLQLLADSQLPAELVQRALSVALQAAARHVEREHAAPIWTELWAAVERCPAEQPELLLRLLQLLLQLVTLQQGALLLDPAEAARRCGQLLSARQLPGPAGHAAAQLAAQLLSCRHGRLETTDAARLIIQVLRSPQSPAVVLRLPLQLLDEPLLESHALVELVAYLHTLPASQAPAALGLLSRLVLHKRAPPLLGADWAGWRAYPLDFNLVLHKQTPRRSGRRGQSQPAADPVTDHVRALLRPADLSWRPPNGPDLARALLVAPHVRPLDAAHVGAAVWDMWCRLADRLAGDQALHIAAEPADPVDEVRLVWPPLPARLQQQLSLLSQLTEAGLRLSADGGATVWSRALTLASARPLASSVHLLRVLDLLLTSADREQRSDALLLTLYRTLGHNLASPHHKLRALTLHLLSLFEPELPAPPEPPAAPPPCVFVTCWAAECQPADIQTYKERLKHLQLLDAEYISHSLPVCGDFSMAPLLYLLGSLHVPFRLLWAPCKRLLAGHCLRLATDRLAHLWSHVLCQAASAVQQPQQEAGQGGQPEVTEEEADEGQQCIGQDASDQTMEGVPADLATDTSDLEAMERRLALLDDRVDMANFRLLLWGVTAELCPLLEPACGEQLIGQLFQFLDAEFFSSDMSFAKHQNLLDSKVSEQNSAPGRQSKGAKQDKETPMDDGEQDEEEGEHMRKKSMGKKKGIVQALVAHLTVMSKMTGLRRSDRSAQLWDTFLHFLTHKRTDVQRVALECVYAHRPKGLNPYRETLFSLLADTNFKTKLTSLSIDTETGLIKTEHRQRVLPVLTRILYGRMRTSTGKGAASRDNSAARRRVIVGFLAGCCPAEIDDFLDLTLGALAAHVQDDAVQMVTGVMAAADVRCALPPRQLQSSLLLLTAVLFKLRSRLAESVGRLLRLLLCAAATVAGLLEHQHCLPVWHVRTLKKIRVMVLSCLGDMYEWFDAHTWSACETDAVFAAAVWPSLPRLTQESTTAPTALLKLFTVWAASPRYFPLLAKQRHDGLSPVSEMMSLLSVRACHVSVTTAVMRAAQHLLTLPTLDTAEPGSDTAASHEPVSGPAIVAAHVTPLLEYLRQRLRSGAGGRLSATELAVLSAVCKMDGEPARQHAASLASLLLPVLAAPRPPPEQRQKQLLNTLKHLLSAADRPCQFVRPLSGLCSHLPGRESHLAVVDCLATLALHDPALLPIAAVVGQLNAMAACSLDEPDFERRLVVYGQVNERLRQADRIDDDFLRVVVHNCFWFIEHESDLALRDSATFCLQEVARAVGRLLAVHRSAATAFASSCLLPAVRLRLRCRADDTRHHMVAVLQSAVQACADHLPRLQQLQQLCSPTDAEADFFENIRHIQVHRRTRALKRVVEGLSDGSLQLRTDVITNYILPLANVYLFNDNYSKYTALTDITVRLLGLVAGRMTWHQYQAFLRHYLALLPTCTRQRDAVKVLVAVLDAFPFDLSSVTPDVANSIIGAARAEQAARRGGQEGHLQPAQSGVGTKGDGAAGSVEGDVASGAAGGGAVPAEGEAAPAEGGATLAEGEAAPAEGEAAPAEGEATPAEGEIAPTGQEATTDGGDDALAEEQPDETTGPMDSSAVELPEEEERPPPPPDGPARHRQAEAICRTVIRSTLPCLHAGLVRRAAADRQHALNRPPAVDEERTQRLPLALAMVKLLQKLPHGILEANVASVLVRVCELLRSPTPSVRECARDTLARCLRSLGAPYVPLALRELRTSGGRGYQLHVLVYSTHALLRALCDLLRPGDLDPCVDGVIEVCQMELFGQMAEEKDVQKITSKTAEAKGIKSYKLLHILAKFITESSLFPLIQPLQQWVLTSRTAKCCAKVAECLRHVCSGLVENSALATPALLVLGHGLVSQSLPTAGGRGGRRARAAAAAVQLPPWLRRTHSLLLPTTPKRTGAPAKVTVTVNSHLLVDFGLQLLTTLLRKERVSPTEPQHLAMLDPFLPLLVKCLEDPDVQLVTVCLRCWSHLLTYPLPSLPALLPTVSGALFSLLHQYAVPGLGHGDNLELVTAAFKAVTVLVRDVRGHTLTEQQLRVLLTYIEQELPATGRQSAAFQLLRAVLSRRLHAAELATVVRTVARLAVTAEAAQTRAQARSVLIQYLLDYPLGDKVKKHVMFFLQQLGYQLECGRLAALEVCAAICQQFPQGTLSSLAPLMLLHLSARLVSEPSPQCRRQVALTVTALVGRVTPQCRRQLVDMTLTWLRGEHAAKKVEQGRTAAQLVGLFLAEDVGDVPESDLDLILPHICSRINPDGNDYLASPPQTEPEEKPPEQHSDHLLYQLLSSLLKLLVRWPDTMAADHRHAGLLTACWQHVQQYLLHPHAWVRLASGQLIGVLLARLEPQAVAACLTGCPDPVVPAYLASDTARTLRSLSLDLCVQLSSELLTQQLADQCVKNLVWVAKVLICAGALEPSAPGHASGATTPGKRKRARRDSDGSRARTDSDTGSGRARTDSDTGSVLAEPDSEAGLSLRWLTRRLRREVNAEVVKSPRIVIRRCAVFKWLAAVSLSLETQLEPLLHLLLPPLVRELTDPTAPLQLKTLATEVTDLMKRQIGVEAFTAAFSKAQAVLNQRKADRRVQRAQQLLTNPVKTASLKMQKHLKKSAAKKRKIMQDKKVGFKRRKVT